MLFRTETLSFACGGCLFGSQTETQEVKKETAKDKEAKSKISIKAVYKCPTCDYSQAKPGNCPKCGMKLEEKTKPIEKPKHH